MLLDAGADVNGKPAKTGGYTALTTAASSGDIETVELLLKHGADVNAPAIRYKGQTALQAAALHGNLDIVNRLIDAGANVHAPGASYKGGTALHGTYAKVVPMVLVVDTQGEANLLFIISCFRTWP